jgi:hypothetical protein
MFMVEEYAKLETSFFYRNISDDVHGVRFQKIALFELSDSYESLSLDDVALVLRPSSPHRIMH